MDVNNLWISSLLLNYADDIIITKMYLKEWIHREIIHIKVSKVLVFMW